MPTKTTLLVTENAPECISGDANFKNFLDPPSSPLLYPPLCDFVVPLSHPSTISTSLKKTFPFRSSQMLTMSMLKYSCKWIGRFQKISIPYHGRPFGTPRARGGSLNWKSEGMGGYLRLEFRRHGGFRSGISTGDRQECIP